uniref:uncharacterized protein LOC100185427 isoform X2 n=1 Tax=Ciona intestinalis TaxID=7719 RepID=UPI000EF51133|nr:uncharacterized protein LOC100185427 isoform X2 [Ciona intestinalis]|eukprot:XP_026694378.1 uncharacterized protein LOC100185427 isoform X2 [Ciona intestinalis]
MHLKSNNFVITHSFYFVVVEIVFKETNLATNEEPAHVITEEKESDLKDAVPSTEAAVVETDTNIKHTEENPPAEQAALCTLPKPKRVKSGSKLNSILERLSHRQEQQKVANHQENRRESNTLCNIDSEKSATMPTTTGNVCLNVSRETNLGAKSSDIVQTERQAMIGVQCIQNKEMSQSSVCTSTEQRLTQQQQQVVSVGPQTQRPVPWPLMRDHGKATRYQPSFRNRIDSHPPNLQSDQPTRYRPSAVGNITAEQPFRHPQSSSFNAPHSSGYKQENSTSALPYSIVEQKHRNRRTNSLNEVAKYRHQHAAPSYRSSGQILTSNGATSFLDKCWSSKMNTVAASGVPRRATIPGPTRPVQGLSGATPVNKTGIYSNDAPLDLRHPSKMPKMEYAVTDDGVLDFSMAARNRRSSGSDGSKPESSVNSSFVTNRRNSQSSSRAIHNKVALHAAHSTGHQTNQILPANIPLKFHDVRFDKGRQTHGAGIGGRPLKAFRNVTPRPLPTLEIGNRKLIPNRQGFGAMQPYEQPLFRQGSRVVTAPKKRPRDKVKEIFVPFPPPGPEFKEKMMYVTQKRETLPVYNRPPPDYEASTKAIQHQRPKYGPKYPPMQNNLPIPAFNETHSNCKGVRYGVPGNTFKMPVCRSIDNVSSQHLDKEVMKRCISKAQHELNRQPYDARHQTNVSASRDPSYGSRNPAIHKFVACSQSSNRPHCERAHHNQKHAVPFPGGPTHPHIAPYSAPGVMRHTTCPTATNSSNVPPPLPRVMSSNSRTTLENNVSMDTETLTNLKNKPTSPRESLTMTPGFDEPAKDDKELNEQNVSAPTSHQKDVFTPQTGPQNITQLQKGLTLNEKSLVANLTSKEAELGAPQGDSKCGELYNRSSNQLSPSVMFSVTPACTVTNSAPQYMLKSDLHSKSIFSSASISVEDALCNNELKETNLCKESADNVTHLKETNLSKDTTFFDESKSEMTNGNDENPNSEEDSAKPSKKFVQKLKLRAVTSQERDGATAKKWTLVDEKQLAQGESETSSTLIKNNEISKTTTTPLKTENRGRQKRKLVRSKKQNNAEQQQTAEQANNYLNMAPQQTFTKRLDLYSVKIALSALGSVGLPIVSLRQDLNLNAGKTLVPILPKLPQDVATTVEQSLASRDLGKCTSPTDAIDISDRFHVQVSFSPQCDHDGVFVEDKVVVVESTEEKCRNNEEKWNQIDDPNSLRLVRAQKRSFAASEIGDIEYVPAVNGDHSYSKTSSSGNSSSNSSPESTFVNHAKRRAYPSVRLDDNDLISGGRTEYLKDDKNSLQIKDEDGKFDHLSTECAAENLTTFGSKCGKTNLAKVKHFTRIMPAISIRCGRNKLTGSVEQKRRSIRKYSKNFVS